MFKFLGFTFLLLQVFPCTSYAQSVLKTGLLVEIKTKIALPNNWQLAHKFQNRQILLESTLDQELITTYEIISTN